MEFAYLKGDKVGEQCQTGRANTFLKLDQKLAESSIFRFKIY